MRYNGRDGVAETKTASDYISNYGTGDGMLPGKLGLAQSILRVWVGSASTNHSKLRIPLALMETLGAVNRYKKKKRDAGSYQDLDLAVTHLLKDKNLFNAGDCILDTLMATIPAPEFDKSRFIDKDSGLKTDSEILSYEFTKGKTVYFAASAKMIKANGGQLDWGKLSGPFINVNDLEEFYEWIAKSLWSASNGRIASLGYGYVGPTGGSYEMTLTWIDKETDFVPGSEGWNDTDQIVSRCNKFIKAEISRGILLSGAPGTGKSSLARMIGSKVGDSRVLQLDGTVLREFPQPYISKVLNYLKPSAVILDDYDRSGGDSNYALSLLESSSSNYPRIFIITANMAERLDPALLRPGRIDEIHSFGVPNKEFRKNIFKYYIKKWSIECDDASLKNFIEESADMVPAEIRSLCEVMQAIGPGEVSAALERLKKHRYKYSANAIDGYYGNQKKVAPTLAARI